MSTERLTAKFVRNYVYGASAPDITANVDAALHTAHKLRNTFCELERAKRSRFYEIVRTFAPEYRKTEEEITEAERQLGDARYEIQEQRRIQRTKTPANVAGIREKAETAKARLKELRAKLKSMKASVKANVQAQQKIKESQEQHKRECKEAEAESGLYWGTRATVRASCASFASGPPPRFARYSGEGQLSVQLQGGCKDIHEPNTLCYITLDGRRGTAFIRIGSSGRSPVFARVPIIFHRPLPSGASVKWAHLERRKMADKDKWYLRLAIDIHEEVNRDQRSWVAVHFGWTMQPDGLRVAIWRGSDGKQGAFVLSHQHMSDYDRLDEVKAKRDTALNEIMEVVSRHWRGKERPEWMPRPQDIRSARRLVAVFWKWKEERPNDEILKQLDDWRKTDKHRWQHQCRLSARVRRRRNDAYRCYAKQLSDRYGVLYTSKIDVKKLTENSAPEDVERDNSVAHRRANQAAISTLARFLHERFPIHGIVVDSTNLTRQCHKCGEICPVNKRKVQCTSCRSWDVDENALENTIARGEAAQKAGALLDLRKALETKEENAKEKLKKMQDARRAARARNHDL